MPQQYFAACPSCGKRYAVRLTDAGTQRSCSACPATFTVPNSLKLKELSGDPYPHLRPIEKIRRALTDSAPPFDGRCHGCASESATNVVPITMSIMEERTIAASGGIWLWLVPWIAIYHILHLPTGFEQWSKTVIPLTLCEQCGARYQRDRNQSRFLSIVKILLLAAAVGGFVWLASRNLEFAAAYAKPIAILAIIPALLIARARGTRSRSFIEPWLRRIDWADDALDAEDEYRLQIGKLRPIARDNAM